MQNATISPFLLLEMFETLIISVFVGGCVRMYKVASKVLQYFSKVRHNSIASDTFTEVIKATNNTKSLNAELTWHSLSATHRICFYGLSSMILDLRVFAWSSRFMESERHFLKHLVTIL